jgi:hypothetical protein
MSKHTPGPWMVDYLDKAGQRVVRNEHIEICTCWHHSVLSIEREMEANARLIAAAPALLAALTKATRELNAIRARDGAPQHISWDRGHAIQTDCCTHQYWDALTEECYAALAAATPAEADRD